MDGLTQASDRSWKRFSPNAVGLGSIGGKSEKMGPSVNTYLSFLRHESRPKTINVPINEHSPPPPHQSPARDEHTTGIEMKPTAASVMEKCQLLEECSSTTVAPAVATATHNTSLIPRREQSELPTNVARNCDNKRWV